MWRRSIAAVIVGLGLVACGDDEEVIHTRFKSTPADGEGWSSTDDALRGAVVRVRERTYHCIKYSTVDRGGLWCERVEEEVP